MCKALLHKSRSAAVQPRAMSQLFQAKPRYRTTNCKQYNAALKARGSLTIWLDKGMSWFAAACGKCGRRPQFSDAAVQFCLTIKNLFGLALRQTTGFVQSLLALSGLLRLVPDFSTLCRRQRSLDVQVACLPSSGGLNLLLDSTGPKFLGEGEWKCKKHGAERRRQWRKLHIGIDARHCRCEPSASPPTTSAIRPWCRNCWHKLAPLPQDEPLLSVTGDGAYDTQPVYAAVMERNAMPQCGNRCMQALKYHDLLSFP
ncbi:IS5 family transposase [Comamonas testosteroni]|uniref:IS5 family transposase n=1 Tax=Comamonas testosteroni TaxID=285 RepID=UPI000A8249D6|nr:IS5 family transposase [Comamonas testosteroni]